MDYTNQLKVIKRFKVKEGQSERFNCPFCNGYNTLGITNYNGVLEWNCFKASCTAHGISNEGYSIEGMKERLDSSASNINKRDARGQGKPIPDFLVGVDSHSEIVDYLVSVNSYLPYKLKLVDIKYSPTEDRVMFPVYEDYFDGKKSPVGYTGRRINGLYGPKWLKYGDTSSFFACGRGQIGVLVEDAPSACAVGVLPDYTGISLLGTHLTKENKYRLINNFNELIICLDPDASRKAIELSGKLSGLVKTSVKLIPDDLKYFKPEKIKEILNGTC